MKYFSVLLLFSFLFLGCESKTSDSTASQTRQEEVAEKGAMVMPFDLDRSTHVFEKIEGGGIQQVVSDDADVEQITLIQDHLKEISERFKEGNFHDPQAIHGHHMPGMHDLVMAKDKLTIEYSDLDNGGQIAYSSEDEKTVKALHAWFDAQVSDHGKHAQSSH